MRHYRTLFKTLVISAGVMTTALFSPAREPLQTVPAKMTVTLDVVPEGKRMPDVTLEDIVVKQNKEQVRVTEWAPARGDRAGLDLFILIDDASETGLGTELKDLRAFIEAQGPATSVGVGYMRNGTVQIAQNFTVDHVLAGKAIRLPMGSTGAYGSPYLSVVDLMKRWPEHPNRREIVMVTDGIDRARRTTRSRLEPISPDVDYASAVAQRTGTIVHTIYFPGIGRMHHNFWEMNNGQNGMAKLSEETGGESFSLALGTPVSIRPYLDQIQNILNNQYLLTFEAKPLKKAGLQRVTLTTEVAGVEFAAADNVWLPAAK